MNERRRRIGENEAIFRSVNEEIGQVNATFTAQPSAMRIVCECGLGSCAEQIAIAPDEYRRVREDAELFVLKPGHDLPETETVVSKAADYWIVRKDPGVPAALAEAMDPRQLP